MKAPCECGRGHLVRNAIGDTSCSCTIASFLAIHGVVPLYGGEWKPVPEEKEVAK